MSDPKIWIELTMTDGGRFWIRPTALVAMTEFGDITRLWIDNHNQIDVKEPAYRIRAMISMCEG